MLSRGELLLHGGAAARGIALVPPQDIGEDSLVGDRLGPGNVLEVPATGAHFRAGGDINLGVGVGANDGANIAAVEHRAGLVAWLRGDLTAAASALTDAERGYLDVGDRWTACLARLGAARVARHTGRSRQAAALHRTNLLQGLELTVSSFDFVGLPQDLQGLALLASHAGEHELAATLLGAATSLRTAVELPEEANERSDRERVLERAAAMLGDAQASAAYERGTRLSAEESVRLALDRTVGLHATPTTA